MSDPFIPVSSQNGLEIPWDMIMSEGATWNPPREGAPPIPNIPVYSQPTMPPIQQYPNMPPQRTMPAQRIDYNIPINGTCEAKEVVVQCPITAVQQNRYAPSPYTQPTGGAFPLSFFVG